MVNNHVHLNYASETLDPGSKEELTKGIDEANVKNNKQAEK